MPTIIGDTQKLGRALTEGFVFQGEMMEYRGEPRGEPSASLPPTAFIAFIQNHDQVGNRAFGERITAIASPEAVRAIAAVYLLLPQIPMLFMGEEWAASQPFPFFCDFVGELADAVRKGTAQGVRQVPGVQGREGRGSASPTRRPRPPSHRPSSTGARWLRSPMRAGSNGIAACSRCAAPRSRRRLAAFGGDAARFELIGEEAVLVRWRLGGGEELALAANLSATPREGFPAPSGRILWQEGAAKDGRFAPWAVRWSIGRV